MERHFTGSYANLRLVQDELLSEPDFDGQVNLLADASRQREGALDFGFEATIVIAFLSGAATAAGKALVEAAIKKAAARGKISEIVEKEHGSSTADSR